MISELIAAHVRWLVRARDVLGTVLLATGAVALAGLLALHDDPSRALAASSIVWLTAGVGGLIAGARVIAAEHQGGGLQGMLLAPVDRRDLFLARAVTLAGVVALVSLLTLGLVLLLVPGLPGASDPRLVLPVLAGSLGLGPLGALAGWASLSTRVGEILAPGLALPLAAPILVAGLHALEALLAGHSGFAASLTFETGYALSVGALTYLVSEPVTEVT